MSSPIEQAGGTAAWVGRSPQRSPARATGLAGCRHFATQVEAATRATRSRSRHASKQGRSFDHAVFVDLRSDMFEDHEYNPSWDDPAIDHAAWANPKTTDRTEVEAILHPYPELWAQWQSKMDDPAAVAIHGTGGIHMMHNSKYLRDVIRQHLWLTVGSGDPPMTPAVAERMVAVLSRRPQYAENRAQFLADPWSRATQRGTILAFYNPEVAAKDIALHEQSDDPFSETSLRSAQFWGAMERGGSVSITDASTGEVVADWIEQPSPPSQSRSTTN